MLGSKEGAFTKGTHLLLERGRP